MNWQSTLHNVSNTDAATENDAHPEPDPGARHCRRHVTAQALQGVTGLCMAYSWHSRYPSDKLHGVVTQGVAPAASVYLELHTHLVEAVAEDAEVRHAQPLHGW